MIVVEKLWRNIRNSIFGEPTDPVVKIAPQMKSPVGQKQLFDLKKQARNSTFLKPYQINNNRVNTQNVEFVLVQVKEIKQNEQMSMKQHKQLIEESIDTETMDLTYEVRELAEKMAMIDIKMDDLEKAYLQSYEVNTARINQQVDLAPVSTPTFLKEYNEFITNFLREKYTKQRQHYPLLTHQQFKTIMNDWSNKKKDNIVLKTTGLKSVQKLTYKAMGTIGFGQWLNDDVVNIYGQLLQKYILDPGSSIKMTNSFFSTNTINNKETIIQRFLKKKNIESHNVIIMPVNCRNHWYFAKFQDHCLFIYDSMRKDPQFYKAQPIFKNAFKFAKWFYGKQPTLIINDQYPQQDNYYDCGVFMLMGMRDVIQGSQWSFNQNDIRYKRLQLAHQVRSCTILNANRQ